MSRRTLMASVALVIAGCSSIPDVVFRDGDGGTAPDADADAGAEEPEAGLTGTCPGTAPSNGFCCEDLPCIGCTEQNCTRCRRAGCAGGEVCCARNPIAVDCRQPAACP